MVRVRKEKKVIWEIGNNAYYWQIFVLTHSFKDFFQSFVLKTGLLGKGLRAKEDQRE